jgi:hypothetical protein
MDTMDMASLSLCIMKPSICDDYESTADARDSLSSDEDDSDAEHCLDELHKEVIPAVEKVDYRLSFDIENDSESEDLTPLGSEVDVLGEPEFASCPMVPHPPASPAPSSRKHQSIRALQMKVAIRELQGSPPAGSEAPEDTDGADATECSGRMKFGPLPGCRTNYPRTALDDPMQSSGLSGSPALAIRQMRRCVLTDVTPLVPTRPLTPPSTIRANRPVLGNRNITAV